MANAEDLRFGKKKTKTRNIDLFDRHTKYHGTWSNGSRQRYIEAVRERLNALAKWRGAD